MEELNIQQGGNKMNEINTQESYKSNNGIKIVTGILLVLVVTLGIYIAYENLSNKSQIEADNLAKNITQNLSYAYQYGLIDGAKELAITQGKTGMIYYAYANPQNQSEVIFANNTIQVLCGVKK